MFSSRLNFHPALVTKICFQKKMGSKKIFVFLPCEAFSLSKTLQNLEITNKKKTNGKIQKAQNNSGHRIRLEQVPRMQLCKMSLLPTLSI